MLDSPPGPPRSTVAVRGQDPTGVLMSKTMSGTTAGRRRTLPSRKTSAKEPDAVAKALQALHAGDFSARLAAGPDVSPAVAAAFNALAVRNGELCSELQRVSNAVGKEG